MSICAASREGMNARLAEARELFAVVKAQTKIESHLPQSTPLATVLRGHIYVSLYGAVEYSVTSGTQAFIRHLCALEVNTKHLEHVLYSIALDSELTSARDAGIKKKWQTRRQIFAPIATGSVFSISDTVFGSYLHNVYANTIEDVFGCIGIVRPPTAHPSEIAYLKEITEKRNSVAHGRELASEAAKALSLDEVEKRLNVTYSICSYFFDAIDQHATDLGFVEETHRSLYGLQR